MQSKNTKFICRAPTRVDLAGGTLDLWPIYCLFSPVRTINLAIDLYASVAFEKSEGSEFEVEIISTTKETYRFRKPLSAALLKEVPRSVAFPAAVVSHYLAQKEALPRWKLRIEINTTAPMGSGLGGSSTLCVALVRGLSRLWGDFAEQGWQTKFLEWVRDLEAFHMKTPTGTQDYLAALFGGLHCYVSRIGGWERVSYSEETYRAIAERTAVVFSGELHHSGLSNWELYKKAIDNDANLLKGLEAIRQVAEATHFQLNQPKINWAQLGKLFEEEWSVRKNTFRVNTPLLDEISDYLAKQDIIGHKICGAAAGGSFLVLVDPAKRQEFEAACAEKKLQVLATKPTSSGVHVS